MSHLILRDSPGRSPRPLLPSPSETQDTHLVPNRWTDPGWGLEHVVGWELGSKRGRPGLQDHSTAASGPPSLLFPMRLQHRAPSTPGEGDPHRRWRLLYNHSSSRFCHSGQNRAANRIITSSPPAGSSLPAVAPISVMGQAAPPGYQGDPSPAQRWPRSSQPALLWTEVTEGWAPSPFGNCSTGKAAAVLGLLG